MTGLSNVSERNQPGEHRDKHLIAPLIPISLTIMEQLAAPELAKAAKPMQGPDFGSDWSNTPFLRSMSVPGLNSEVAAF
jgi:hypothetical protein